ncbi:hypothetical protein M432DRAFT_135102 [Thermoascus aurantiacus ATCC 26904]
MAEIGLVASVFGVIQLGQAVASAVLRYMDSAKNAKDDIITIEAELKSMRQVLEKLQAFPKGNKYGQSQLSSLKDCESSLEECRSVMEDIRQKLDTGLNSTKPSKRERFTNGLEKKTSLAFAEGRCSETVRCCRSSKRDHPVGSCL